MFCLFVGACCFPKTLFWAKQLEAATKCTRKALRFSLVCSDLAGQTNENALAWFALLGSGLLWSGLLCSALRWSGLAWSGLTWISHGTCNRYNAVGFGKLQNWSRSGNFSIEIWIQVQIPIRVKIKKIYWDWKQNPNRESNFSIASCFVLRCSSPGSGFPVGSAAGDCGFYLGSQMTPYSTLQTKWKQRCVKLVKNQMDKRMI